MLKQIGLFAGLILFAVIYMSPAPEGLSRDGWLVLGAAGLMAIWWLTEALPLAATALVPAIIFPILGIADVKEVGRGYANKVFFLTLGGFLIGVALQRWQLHERLALQTIRIVGTNPRRVIGGFMLASAFLSMWITNTGTTVMMLPIAMSVATLLTKQEGVSEQDTQKFAVGLMLALAYAATLGGMSSLVGTSTNVMFKGYMEDQFGFIIDFNDWLMIGMPISLTMLIIVWALITFVLFPFKLPASKAIGDLVQERLKKLGKLSQGEKLTALVFFVTVGLWLLKDVVNGAIPAIKLNDASIAIIGGVLLFILPSGTGKNERLLKWEDTVDVPWGILLLLGSGLCIAGLMNQTGVAEWMGGKFAGMDGVSVTLLILLTTGAVILLSEMMSNVATLAAFLPVIVTVAIGYGENPLMLAVPAALAASCAFMLPIGTPPNAVVFGSGYITIPQMARTGLLLNIIGLIVINIIAYFVLQYAFGVEAGVVPEWAVLQPPST